MDDLFVVDEEKEEKSAIYEVDPYFSNISDAQLVELLSQRVIYNTEDLIAFDKPVRQFFHFLNII
jgi:hypothetical protein